MGQNLFFFVVPVGPFPSQSLNISLLFSSSSVRQLTVLSQYSDLSCALATWPKGDPFACLVTRESGVGSLGWTLSELWRLNLQIVIVWLTGWSPLRWFWLLLAHANVNLGRSHHTPGSSDVITSFGTSSPILCRWNVVVPNGTVGLLHKRVKLQQRRWHRAPFLTRFPAPTFFPPAGSAAVEWAVTSLLAQSQSCQLLCFFLSTPIFAAAVLRENIGVLEKWCHPSSASGCGHRRDMHKGPCG